MAKQIVITCDNHPEGERPVASTIEIGIFGKVRTVDLCDPCVERLVFPLARLLEEEGLEVEKTKKKAPVLEPGGKRQGKPPEGERDWQCLWCEMDYAGPSGLVRHVQTIHGLGDGKQQVLVFGDVCPLCERKSASMGQHAIRSHPFCKNTSQLFVHALAGGDPYGVVAAVRARVS